MGWDKNHLEHWQEELSRGRGDRLGAHGQLALVEYALELSDELEALKQTIATKGEKSAEGKCENCGGQTRTCGKCGWSKTYEEDLSHLVKAEEKIDEQKLMKQAIEDKQKNCPHTNKFSYNHGYHTICLDCNEEL